MTESPIEHLVAARQVREQTAALFGQLFNKSPYFMTSCFDDALALVDQAIFELDKNIEFWEDVVHRG